MRKRIAAPGAVRPPSLPRSNEGVVFGGDDSAGDETYRERIQIEESGLLEIAVRTTDYGPRTQPSEIVEEQERQFVINELETDSDDDESGRTDDEDSNSDAGDTVDNASDPDEGDDSTDDEAESSDSDTSFDDGSPGFGVGSALAGIGGIGYPLKCRLPDSSDEEYARRSDTE